MTATPNLDKMIARKEESRTIQNFIDWYCDEFESTTHGHLRSNSGDRHREKVMSLYFDIDLDKAEQERMAILGDVRRQNHTMDVLKRRKTRA